MSLTLADMPAADVRHVILRDIQDQQREWCQRNFPQQADHHPVMGVVEEVGELCEGWVEENMAQVKDSLGDIFVYAVNVCNRHDFDFARLTALAYLRSDRFQLLSHDQLLLRAAAIAGKIDHHQLKMDQGIRGSREVHMLAIEDRLADLWAALETFARRCEWNLLTVLTETWGEVMRRDWQKNPSSGVV